MKTINNREFTIEVEGLDEHNKEIIIPIKLDYFKLILNCVDRTISPAGFTYDEIKKISKIEQVIKTNETKKEINFEDADFDFIKEKVSNMTWKFRKKEFLEFKEYIDSIKE